MNDTLITPKLLIDTIANIGKYGSVLGPLMYEYQILLHEIHQATHGATEEDSSADYMQ